MVAPAAKEKYEKLLEMKDLQENLNYYKEVNEKNEAGARAEMLVGLNMVDAQNKLEEDEEKLKKEILEMEIPSDKNSKFAIVMCGSPDKAGELMKAIEVTKEDPVATWGVKKAALPDDIMWENIGVNQRLLKRPLCCVNTIIILLLIFLFTPTFFISIISQALGGLGVALDVLIVNLPALIVILYMNVLIPKVIAWMVKRE